MKSLVKLLLILGLFGLSYLALDRFLSPALPRLGVQAWTFRRFTFAETLDKASSLGIHYMEAFPGQTLGGGLEGKFNHRMDEATQQKVLEMAKSKGVKLVSYGVVNGRDEAEWQQIFAFARAMGLQNITSEPPQEMLPMLDKLSQQRGITLAFHNHPTPSRYANPATALDALTPYGSNLGVCADTGHWVRSGYNPVESLYLLHGRILESHFKDLDQWAHAGKDVPWGTGTSNAAGQLAELRRQGFGGFVLIEYENDTPHLEEDVRRCVEYFNLAMKAPLTDLETGKVSPPGFTTSIDQVLTNPTEKDSSRWPQPLPLISTDFSNVDLLPDASWSWSQDVLSPQPKATLWTKETYGDFVLSFDARCLENSSGGIILRVADPKIPNSAPIKIQILQATPANDKEANGAIAGCLAPTRQIPVTPGDWNSYVIIAAGSKIRVILNHEEIVNMNLDDWKETGKNPDGSTNQGTTAYKDASRTGRIGLQSGDVPVQFRSVMLEKR